MKDEDKKAKRRRRKGSSIITKESVSAVFAVFSLLSFIILCTKETLFGAIGGAVYGFLLGVLGCFAYPVMLAVFYLSFMGLIGKRLVRNRKAGACITVTIILIALIVHTALTYTWQLDEYLERCFEAPTLSTKPFITVTGWMGGVAVWGCAKLMTKVGALILFSVLTLLFGYLSFVSIRGRRASGEPKPKKVKKGKEKPDKAVEIPLTQTVAQQPVQSTPPTSTTVTAPQQPGVVFNTPSNSSNGRSFSPFSGSVQGVAQPQDASIRDERRRQLYTKTPQELYRDNLIFDPNAQVNNRPQNGYGTPAGTYTGAYQNAVNEKPMRPKKIVTDLSSTYSTPTEQPPVATPSYTPPQPPVQPELIEPIAPVEPIARGFQDRDERVEEPVRDDFRLVDEPTRGFEERDGRISEDVPSRSRERSGLEIFDEVEDDPYSLRDDFSTDRREVETPTGRDEFGLDRREVETPTGRDEFGLDGRGTFGYTDENRDNDFLSSRGRDELRISSDRDEFLTDRREESSFGTPMQRNVAPMSAPTPVPTPKPPQPRIIRPYVQPRLDDFTCTDIMPTHDYETEETIKNGIIETLEKNKVMGATVVSTTHGPTVTRYNVAITIDTSPQKVLGMEDSFQMSLHSSLVNVTPNYDNGTISIEVPNKNRQFVNLGSMLSGDTFVNAKPSSLMFAMGKDVFNAKVYGDLTKMVHLLVAGGTGGGKSVFLGAMIMSLIYKYSPEELRLILIDPKKTEFSLYYNLPHLMINEIITDSKKTVRALNWVEGEMNRRYELIRKMTRSGKFVQSIDQYNSYVEKENKLPKLVVIIDELADLMLTSERKEIEDRIQSLTQKARAASIHVVVATQRPSTNVITGVIKSNLTTRIAFSVPSDVDSRVILDHSGAQNLCGLGDMLYYMASMKSPVRVQSPFIAPEEAQRIVNFIKENNEAYYDEEATAYIQEESSYSEGSATADSEEFDPVYIQALRYVILSNTASISLVQRRCSVGYNKAGKIIDWMDNKGYITAFDGSKARKVLITKEQFEDLYGPF